jgi:hypothetical protein
MHEKILLQIRSLFFYPLCGLNNVYAGLNIIFFFGASLVFLLNFVV